MAVLRNGQRLGEEVPASQKAITRLAREGILLPDKPEWPQENLPESLTDLPDEDLIQLFVRVTGWAGFLANRAAAAMVDERAAETVLEIARAKSLAESWGGTNKDRVTIAKAEGVLDPVVIKATTKHEEAYSYRKLVESLADNTAKNAAAVSRELTRRTSGPAPENRDRRYRA